MAFLASLQEVSKSFGARPLFRSITVGVAEGERIGLIGPNGSGKSTLLRILAGEEKPDGGTVSTRRGLRLEYVPQQDVFPPGATVTSVLAGALRDLPMDEHERDLHVSMMLGRVAFPDPEQAVDTLSGGWRKRLAIARALIREPELLLLDEPTNHLDLEAIAWMEEILDRGPFAWLIVSHDRYLLQRIANRIVEINPAYAEGYLSVEGSYADFVEQREAYLQAQAHQQVALSSQVRREVEWLRKSAPARSTKAGGRIRQAEQMIQNLAELRHRNNQGRTANIDFSATRRQTRRLLVAQGISRRLAGRALFSGLDIELAPGTRLGLIGPNGSGKSTLLRVLTSAEASDTGHVKPAEGLRVVLFDQNREQLDRSQRLRAALAPSGGDTVIYRDHPMHVAAWAKRFLFRSEQLEMAVEYLSGGEQARVLIARLMLQPADVLILDEPTNDLDIPTLEVLEDSLREFPGALILVTHDRYMLDNVCTEMLALDGKGKTAYYADFHQWEQAQEIAREAEREREQAAARPTTATRQNPANPLTNAEQRELSRIEGRIETAEAEVERLQADMAKPEVVSDHAKVQELWKQVEAAQGRVAELYARWEFLEAKRTG